MGKTWKSVIGVIIIILTIWVMKFTQIGFYDYVASDTDLYRIPLIYPYEINSSNGQYWSISSASPMHPDKSPFDIGVDSVCLCKDLVLVYADNVITLNSNIWYVFDTNTKSKNIFTQNEGFKRYLKTKCGKMEVKMYSPVAIFKKYRQDLTLPPEWEPYVEYEKNKSWWGSVSN